MVMMAPAQSGTHVTASFEAFSHRCYDEWIVGIGDRIWSLRDIAGGGTKRVNGKSHTNTGRSQRK